MHDTLWARLLRLVRASRPESVARLQADRRRATEGHEYYCAWGDEAAATIAAERLRGKP